MFDLVPKRQNLITKFQNMFHMSEIRLNVPPTHKFTQSNLLYDVSFERSGGVNLSTPGLVGMHLMQYSMTTSAPARI